MCVIGASAENLDYDLLPSNTFLNIRPHPGAWIKQKASGKPLSDFEQIRNFNRALRNGCFYIYKSNRQAYELGFD